MVFSGNVFWINQSRTVILKPNTFEGLQFSSHAGLARSFSVGHSVTIGKNNGWAFLANYVTNGLTMISRLSPDGHVSGKIIAIHTPHLTSRIQAEAGPNPKSNIAHYDLEYKGSDYTANLKTGNSGVLTVSYVQAVAPWLALGSEFIYIKSNHMSGMTLAARLHNERNVASLNLVPTTGMIDMNYIYKPSANVSFATEFQTQLQTMESRVSAGYNYVFADKSASVTAQINSDGFVTAILTRQIMPSFGLMLSAELDHVREDHRFGLGVTLES